MSKMLRLRMQQQERPAKILAGEISPEEVKEQEIEEEREWANLKKQKTEVLNEVVFPSMANLIVFLECACNPLFYERFDKDIQALFFSKSTVGNKKDPIIKRFIDASMMWTVRNEERGKMKTKLLPEYRFVVAEMMQVAILEMITGGVGQFKFNNDSFLQNVVYQDIGRAVSLIKLLADSAHKTLYDFDQDRRPAKF